MIICRFPNNSEAQLRHVTMVAIVVREGKVLLSKRGYVNGRPIPEFGKWTLPGGYLDKDETIAQGTVREVKEETGCRIKNLRLLRIVDSPKRPNETNQNVTLVFTADYVSAETVKSEETLEQKWFSLDALPPKEAIAFDHSDDLELYRGLLVGEKPGKKFPRLPAELF